MRIAYLCGDPGIPVFGSKGASIHVRALSQALTAQGHAVAVWAARAGGPAPADYAVPVRFPAPGAPPGGVPAPDPQGRHAAGDEERRKGRDWWAGEDFRAARDPRYRDLARLRAAASFRRAVAPEVASFAPDLVYERLSLFGAGGLVLARGLGLPLLLEVNAPLSEEQERHRDLAMAETARAVERRVLAAADRVLAVSTTVADWAVASGARADRVHVLPNGVDAARFAPRRDPRAARRRLGLPEAPTLGFVGSLKPWHGTAGLIEALSRVRSRIPGTRLLIIGDGPERPRLEALAASLGLAEEVSFAGALPHAAVPDWMAAMDLAAVPYDRAAGCYFSPLKLFEAMASGRAVVAAAAGQVAELLDHDRTGWLYPPGDTAALAAALAALLADPSRARRLAEAARRQVLERHSWDQVAEAVAGLAAGSAARQGRAA